MQVSPGVCVQHGCKDVHDTSLAQKVAHVGAALRAVVQRGCRAVLPIWLSCAHERHQRCNGRLPSRWLSAAAAYSASLMPCRQLEDQIKAFAHSSSPAVGQLDASKGPSARAHGIPHTADLFRIQRHCLEVLLDHDLPGCLGSPVRDCTQRRQHSSAWALGPCRACPPGAVSRHDWPLSAPEPGCWGNTQALAKPQLPLLAAAGCLHSIWVRGMLNTS